jgi:hypothetical protein
MIFNNNLECSERSQNSKVIVEVNLKGHISCLFEGLVIFNGSLIYMSKLIVCDDTNQKDTVNVSIAALLPILFY